MTIELRAYQSDALAAVTAAAARGVRRQLGVAATGLGKTVMFTALAREMGDTRTLILAHRDELIDQAIRKVREAWPDAPSVGKVKAGDNQVAAHVVVASVQTLARQARLDKLVSAGTKGGLAFSFAAPAPFGLVVVDEAHHAKADSYKRIIAAMGAGEPDGPLLLGVTATPDRGDGRGLDDVFDEITFTYDLQWGITNGYLSDLAGKRVTIDMDMSRVKVSRGDYEAGATGRVMEAAGAPGLIVRAWLEHAPDRRTLVFTPTVEMADQVRAAFVDAGIVAGWVHGEMDLAERAATLAAYSAGDIQVLANCAVLTEGYDEPRTDCIIVARPTKSRALYTQMVGRGTRLHPDKDGCLVLDVVDASVEHSLVTVPSLFGIRREFAARMESEGMGGAAARELQAQFDVREGRIRAEDADLFKRVRRDGFAWVQVHDSTQAGRRYVVSLGKHAGTVVLYQPDPAIDLWLCGHRNANGQKAVLVRDVSLEMAMGVGEDFARRIAPETTHFADATAAWRRRKPTERQLETARRWRVPVNPKMNAGELADQITARIELSKGRRRRGGA